MQRHIQDLAGKKSIYWQSGIFTYSVSNPLLHPPSPEKQRNTFMFINLSPPLHTSAIFFLEAFFIHFSQEPKLFAKYIPLLAIPTINKTMRILIILMMYSTKIFFSETLHNFYSYETWKCNNENKWTNTCLMSSHSRGGIMVILSWNIICVRSFSFMILLFRWLPMLRVQLL